MEARRSDVFGILNIGIWLTQLHQVVLPCASHRFLSAVMSERIERRHIPYLPFHKQIIREICRPQKDDLLIIAKGLGLRRVSWPALAPLTVRSCALY